MYKSLEQMIWTSLIPMETKLHTSPTKWKVLCQFVVITYHNIMKKYAYNPHNFD
jgi:hypothetical protein